MERNDSGARSSQCQPDRALLLPALRSSQHQPGNVRTCNQQYDTHNAKQQERQVCVIMAGSFGCVHKDGPRTPEVGTFRNNKFSCSQLPSQNVDLCLCLLQRNSAAEPCDRTKSSERLLIKRNLALE